MRLRHKLVLFGAVVLGVAGAVAQGLKVSSASALDGIWVPHFDRQLDGAVKDAETATYNIVFKSQDGSSFVGKYAYGGTGTYQGTLFSAGTTSVISVTYKSGDYYAVWAAKLVSRNEIVGTWHDVAGQSGDFRLIRTR
ncbi:MAG TPA: hypothetical protein VN428_14920 [Bryobacteraceae bacterium]|nr:hypothetical protein [Bryobacteraceae bacterium]